MTPGRKAELRLKFKNSASHDAGIVVELLDALDAAEQSAAHNYAWNKFSTEKVTRLQEALAEAVKERDAWSGGMHYFFKLETADDIAGLAKRYEELSQQKASAFEIWRAQVENEKTKELRAKLSRAIEALRAAPLTYGVSIQHDNWCAQRTRFFAESIANDAPAADCVVGDAAAKAHNGMQLWCPTCGCARLVTGPPGREEVRSQCGHDGNEPLQVE